ARQLQQQTSELLYAFWTKGGPKLAYDGCTEIPCSCAVNIYILERVYWHVDRNLNAGCSSRRGDTDVDASDNVVVGLCRPDLRRARVRKLIFSGRRRSPGERDALERLFCLALDGCCCCSTCNVNAIGSCWHVAFLSHLVRPCQ